MSQAPTTTYTVTKKLNKLLTSYVLNTYNLSSVSDFVEVLRDAPPTDDHIIASLDVKSLFTSVPVDKTIDFIFDRVYRCEDDVPLDIPEKALKTLLKLCTKDALFTCPSGQIISKSMV